MHKDETMSGECCEVCGGEYYHITAGGAKWWDRPCRHRFGICDNSQRLAIERAKEIETLKAEIERMKKEGMK